MIKNLHSPGQNIKNLHLHFDLKSSNLQEFELQITKSPAKNGQISSLQESHPPPYDIVWLVLLYGYV